MLKCTFPFKALALFAGVCLFMLGSYGIFLSGIQGKTMSQESLRIVGWDELANPNNIAVKADCGDDAREKLSPEEKKARMEEIKAQMRARDDRKKSSPEEKKARMEERKAQMRARDDRKKSSPEERKARTEERKAQMRARDIERREKHKRERQEISKEEQRRREEQWEAERPERERKAQEQEQREAQAREQYKVWKEQQEAQIEAEKLEAEKLAVPFRRNLKVGDYASTSYAGHSCRLVTNVSPPLVEIQHPGSYGWYTSHGPSRISKRIDDLYPCRENK